MSEIRALIVDDSSVMRKIVERALRQAGLDALLVHEAGSGAEGLELLKENKVHLILSDINMPSMDGLEFLRQIRMQNLAPGTPVVMITTESSEEHVRQAIEAGAQGYIRKPFTAEQVKERVVSLLNPGR
jgi:two-component system chemotaxis response regulator CheY